MKRFYVDFSGFVDIEAEDEAEAREKFYEELHHAIIEIDSVEEIEEEE